MNTIRTPHEQTAFDMGVDAAKAAASWVIDGNASQDHVRRMVAMLEAGDPAVYDYLPAMPDLSGQWSDDPTPLSLYRDITGNDPDDPADGLAFETLHGATMDRLCDAFEAGVSETFESECERILRAAL